MKAQFLAISVRRRRRRGRGRKTTLQSNRSTPSNSCGRRQWAPIKRDNSLQFLRCGMHPSIDAELKVSDKKTNKKFLKNDKKKKKKKKKKSREKVTWRAPIDGVLSRSVEFGAIYDDQVSFIQLKYRLACSIASHLCRPFIGCSHTEARRPPSL